MTDLQNNNNNTTQFLNVEGTGCPADVTITQTAKKTSTTSPDDLPPLPPLPDPCTCDKQALGFLGNFNLDCPSCSKKIQIGVPSALTNYYVADPSRLRFIGSGGGAPFIVTIPGISTTGINGSGGTPQLYNLADMIVELAFEAGLGGLVTCTNIDDQVYGLIISQDTDFLTILQGLSQVYNFDIYQGDTIRCVRRQVGGLLSIDATIAQGGVVSQGANDARIKIVRQDPHQVPRQLELQTFDATNNYQWTTQEAQRPLSPVQAMPSRTINNIKIPVVIDPTRSRALATLTLYRSWQNRINASLTLGPQYIGVEPGDVLSVTSSGETYVVKVTEVRIKPDFTIDVVANLLLVNLASVTVAGSGGTSTGGGGPGFPATIAHMLDTPLLTRSDDLGGTGLRFYNVVTSRGQGGWPGGSLSASFDGGVTYVREDTQIAPSPTFGAWDAVNPALPAPALGAWMTDYANSLHIILQGGTAPATISTADLYAGLNLCAVGAPGRWEVIAFQTVTPGAGTSVTLSTLLRGRANTEWAMGLHTANDDFVMLDKNVLAGEWPLAELNQTIDYKATGTDQLLSAVAPLPLLITGNAEKPLAPVHVTATSGGSGVTFAWDRRDRLDPGLHDLDGNTPMSEASESYSIDVMNGLTVVRTLTSITPSVLYTNAQITADWGSPQAAYTVNVYQLSAVTGRGFPGHATATVH
jgi:hypothetical protein